MSQGFAKPINSEHGELLGLADDGHTQYGLLAGRSGGQTFIGGTDASDGLTLSSTSNATKGVITVEDDLKIEQFIDFDEISTPSNPAANVGRLYVKDDGGTTTLFFRDNAGTETDLLAGGGGGTPGGSNEQVQFNDSGSFGVILTLYGTMVPSV